MTLKIRNMMSGKLSMLNGRMISKKVKPTVFCTSLEALLLKIAILYNKDTVLKKMKPLSN